MNNIDIFSKGSSLDGEWFYFKKIGDSIQGTYIGSRQAVDQFTNPQTVYLIKDSTGKVFNVAFKNSNVVIMERMAACKLGQIVGFRFEEERPSKRTPGINVKIVRVYSDPKVVDPEWSADQAVVSHAPVAVEGRTPSAPSALNYGYDDDENFVAPEDAGATGGGLPTSNSVEDTSTNNAIQAIRDLAKSKGLVKDGMSDEEKDAVIEQYTGHKLTEENLTKIIIALTGYTG